MFARLHGAYVRLVSSPFYTPGTPIEEVTADEVATQRFEREVAKLLATRANSGVCPYLPAATSVAAQQPVSSLFSPDV